MSKKVATLQIEIAANVARLTEDFSKAQQEVTKSMGSIKAQVAKSMKEITESVDGVNEHIKGMQDAFAAISEMAIGGVIGEQILELGKNFAETAEQISRTAQMTGMTTSQVQELGYAATATGSSSQSMTTGMRKLSTMMIQAENGAKTAVAAFKNVGISQEEVKNSSPHDILMKIADAYAKSADGADKSANAQMLFGRAGMDLIPTLNQGSAGLDALGAKARDLGIVLSQQTIEQGDKANEKFKEMHAVMGAVSNEIGAEMVPAMTAFSTAFVNSAQDGGALQAVMHGLNDIIYAGTVIISGTTTALTIFGDGIAAVAATIAHPMSAKSIWKSWSDDVDALQAKEDKIVASFDAAKTKAEGGAPEGGHNKKPSIGSDTGTRGAHTKSMISEWNSAFAEWKDKQQNYFKDYTGDEEKYWQQKLALVTKGSKDWNSIQDKLYALHKQQAHSQLSDDLAAIKSQYDAAQQGSQERIQLAVKEAQRIGAAYGNESKEYQAAMREVMKSAQEYDAAQQKLSEARINRQKEHDLSLVALDQDRLSQQLKMGQISDANEIKGLIALENQKYQIELQAAQEKAALLQAGSAQQAIAYADIEKLTEKHDMTVQKLNDQAALDYQKQWQSVFSQVSSAFDTSIKGMIMGTTTMQKAMANMAQSIVAEFVNAGVKMVTIWLGNETRKTMATFLGIQQRNAAQAAGDQAGLASGAVTVIKFIMNDAAKTFSGVWAALSGIFGVGPAMAAVAAPAAMATVAGIAGSVASSAGGDWQIPADRLNFVHKNETILPADKSAGLDSLIQQGGGGDTHVHIHATDADSVKRLFAQNGSAIMDAIRGQIRGGALTGMR